MRTTTQIKAAIRAVAKSAAALQDRIQFIAVECVEHAKAHGDATLMLYLCQELPVGQRVQALKDWVHAFSPIKLTTQDGKFVGVKIAPKDSKFYVEWDIDGAKANPYYTFTVENAPKPLTLEALKKIVAGLSKRYEKAQDEGLVDPAEQDEMIAYIKAVQSIGVTTKTVQ